MAHTKYIVQITIPSLNTRLISYTLCLIIYMQDETQPKKHIIYVTINATNGKVYGGKHTGYHNDGYIGSGGGHFKNAVNKYGKEKFIRRDFRLLIRDVDHLNNLEIRLIRHLKRVFKENCYNTHRGGDGGFLMYYATPEQLIEFGKRISKGKKEQYQEGATEKQLLGRLKSIETKRHLYATNEDYQRRIIESRIKAADTIKQRHKEHGFTVKEIERYQQFAESNTNRFKCEITTPPGEHIIEPAISYSELQTKYLFDDLTLIRMRTVGWYIIGNKTHRTKHRFPEGTIIASDLGENYNENNNTTKTRLEQENVPKSHITFDELATEQNYSLKQLSPNIIATRCGLDIYKHLLESTVFISDRTIQERTYCYMKKITALPVCKICNAVVPIGINEYRHGHRYPLWCKNCYKTTDNIYKICYGSQNKLLNPIIQPSNKTLQQVIDSYDGSLRFLTEQMITRECGEQVTTDIFTKTQFLPITCTFQERIYCVQKSINEHPKCHACGINVEFRSNEVNGSRYSQYCSRKCSTNSESVMTKKRATNIEKYGNKNVLNSTYGIEKRSTTMCKKYGATNFFKTDQYKLERPTYKRADPVMIADRLRRNGYRRILARFKDDSKLLITEDEYKGSSYNHMYNWQCVKCNNVYKSWYNNGVKLKCPTCFPGTSLERFIGDILTEHKFEFLRGSKSILDNKRQIDFYIPSLKIGIETHGLFWHRETEKLPKDYHLNKLEDAISKDIRLIQIFADEIENKPEIVTSRILSILGVYKTKIYARECDIRDVIFKDTEQFLIRNHIQGSCRSSINIGLYHEDKLVALGTFSKQRVATGLRNKEHHYELIRFASELHTQIIGGFDRVIKHFIRIYNPIQLISYCDRRWSVGKVYEKNGFKLIKNTLPNYWYSHDGHNRIHRFHFMKHTLGSKLDVYDPLLTEEQNMTNNGYYRIWDCGSSVYEYNLPS